MTDSQHGDDPAVTAEAAGPENEAKTRDRVRAAIVAFGPISAAELGKQLGFTPAAVRRHLDQLENDDVIEVKMVRGSGKGAGRPARRYVLSSHGQAVIGNDYLQIARMALARLEDLHGEEAIREFARDRFSGMKERYQPLLDEAGDDIVKRATLLSQALSADGYIASASQLNISVDSGKRPFAEDQEAHQESPVPTAVHPTKQPAMLAAVQLCQGHCPVLEIAAEHGEFCDMETEAFSELLGVDVRRLTTLAAGGHVCTTHIPTGRQSLTDNALPQTDKHKKPK